MLASLPLLLVLGTAWGGAAEHGALIAGLAGCASCHTAADGAPYAGGYAIDTKFGTFYGPNITPDPDLGIGEWTEADLHTALREGKSPSGKTYYPSFPYPAFTKLTDDDIADLYAFLRTVEPATRPNRPHELHRPYRGRDVLGPWRMLAFRPGAWQPDPERDDALDRGGYLVEAVGHCGECHTPRDAIGKPRNGRALAGNSDPPEPAPNITPHDDALGDWSEQDWILFLQTGMTPEGDFVGGVMRDVVEKGTALLSEADRAAIATWMRAVTPRPDRGRAESTEGTQDEEEDW